VEHAVTISTFFHAGILVRDLDRAIPRFEKVLGITFLPPNPFQLSRFVDVEHFGDEDPHEWSGRAAYSTEGPPFYELLEAKGHGAFSLDNRDEGLHHLGMLVEDAHRLGVSMGLQGVGAGAVGLGSIDGPVHTRVVFTKPADLHGVCLELIDNTSPVIEKLMADAAAYRDAARRGTAG
jgi:Glyoxalase/Bleomycin resistance protein/Dioxygenase superfamily